MTSDYFYHPMEAIQFPLLCKHNIIGVEMEAAALYGISHEHGVKALCMCTITDEIHLKGYDEKHEKFADPTNKFDFKGMSTAEHILF